MHISFLACDSRSILNLQFKGNLNDTSCSKADAMVIRGVVSFVESSNRSAAVFNGSGYIDVSKCVTSQIQTQLQLVIGLNINNLNCITILKQEFFLYFHIGFPKITQLMITKFQIIIQLYFIIIIIIIFEDFSIIRLFLIYFCTNSYRYLH